jgi:acetyl-CoA carboxylase biotin carboxyl carrier protein
VSESTTRTKKPGSAKEIVHPENNPETESPLESAAGFLSNEIKELIKMVESSDITELSIENGSQKILIKREKVVVQQVEATATYSTRGSRASRSQNQAAPAQVSDTPPISDPGAPPEDSFHKIVAPMVGTFYRSPDPKARSFVNDGEEVEKGQVIGIIEAMKIMNEIVSDHAGRCVKISVENGQPVEYGQTLILLEPL